jgi:hypothetical protein
MSELRDRIAYAIAQADGDEPGMEPASCDYEMADAVIRDVLTPEFLADLVIAAVQKAADDE